MKGPREPKERRGRRRKLQDAPTSSAQKRVALYTRKSTTKGLDQRHNSLEAQRDHILSYIRMKESEGWEVSKEYSDAGISGATIEREGLEAMMADIRAGKIDVVAVHKFDRLSRSLADFTQLLAEFSRLGVEIVSVSQNLDSSTPVGRMIVNILASFAQFEREMISERTSEKIRSTRKKGLWTGGHAPYGFQVIDKVLLPDPELAERAEELFQLYLSLGSVANVMDELNRRGWKTVKGRLWTKSSVYNLLRNPTYIGRIPLHGEDFEGQHEAIVDPEVFEKVQVMLDSQGPGRKVEARNKWEMLLRGTLYCAACGAEMVHHYTKKGKQLYHYYRCPKNEIPGAERCAGGTASAPILEDFVIERVRRICQDSAILDAAHSHAQRAADEGVPPIRRELAAIGRERAQVSQQREKLLILLTEDAADPEATRARLGALRTDAQTLEERERQLQEEIVALEDAPVKTEQLRQAIEEFLPLWGQLTIRERIRVLGLLVERIEFDCRTGDTEIVYRDLGQSELREAS